MKAKTNPKELGEKSIGRLLIKQSVPAAIGIAVILLYNIVDTIFVGNGVGPLAIAGVSVVLPITMFIGTIGMSVGIGAASIISRSLGADRPNVANRALANALTLTLGLSILMMILGFIFAKPILNVFGALGDIYPLAYDYYMILLLGVPFLAFAMLGNNVVRAEGAAKTSMMVMVLAGVINLVLDPIFIFTFKWGIKGAAWATVIGQFAAFVYLVVYYLRGKSNLVLHLRDFRLKNRIVREIASIGASTFARQGSMSLTAIVINNSLYVHGGELSVSVYGVINKLIVFSLFPLFGLTQGFIPIVGYNYGARLYNRVRQTFKISNLTALLIGIFFFAIIQIFARPLVSIFTGDEELIRRSADAIRLMTLLLPLIGVQILGAGYFQAVGKALPAFLLTLSRQGFLIPIALIFAAVWGLGGIWYSFAVSDFLAVTVTFLFMYPQYKKLRKYKQQATIQTSQS